MSDIRLVPISEVELDTTGFVIDGEWLSLREIGNELIPDRGGFSAEHLGPCISRHDWIAQGNL